MRHILLPFLALGGLVAVAQPTLQQSMVDPNGLQLDMYLVTSPGSATEPSDGANQTWDLSTVSLQPIGTLDFTASTGTPYAANYPGANWVWAQTVTGMGTEYTYLNIGPNGIAIHATGVPGDVNDYTDPKLILTFPMAFGQNVSDNYVDIDGPASVTWSYTGHGTAITPLGTINDLAKLVSTENDLLLWNTAPLYPMVIDDGSNVLVFAPGNVGLEERGALPVQVYPNPCTEALYVEALAADWRIIDLQGRTVRAGRFSGPALQRIELAGMASGSYLLVLDQGGRHRSVRFSKA